MVPAVLTGPRLTNVTERSGTCLGQQGDVGVAPAGRGGLEIGEAIGGIGPGTCAADERGETEGGGLHCGEVRTLDGGGRRAKRKVKKKKKVKKPKEKLSLPKAHIWETDYSWTICTEKLEMRGGCEFQPKLTFYPIYFGETKHVKSI